MFLKPAFPESLKSSTNLKLVEFPYAFVTTEEEQKVAKLTRSLLPGGPSCLLRGGGELDGGGGGRLEQLGLSTHVLH